MKAMKHRTLALGIVLLATLAGCSTPKTTRCCAEAELAAAPRREAAAPCDQAFSAVLAAALDSGYSPSHVDREAGRFAGWMVGHFDGDTQAKAVAFNVGAVAAATAVTLGYIAVSLLTGGSGRSPPDFSGTKLASGETAVFLFAIVEPRGTHSASIGFVTAAPGSEPIEPAMADAFWEHLSHRVPVGAPVGSSQPASPDALELRTGTRTR